jgi:hypothetical protein
MTKKTCCILFQPDDHLNEWAKHIQSLLHTCLELPGFKYTSKIYNIFLPMMMKMMATEVQHSKLYNICP